jgi:cobalt-zinc-cadmium efflux system outer membrane protein
MEANVKLARETKDTLLPLVMQQTDRLESAYKSGQADLLMVLRAREQRLQLESAVLDATRDFHLARIRYESAVGTHAPASSASSFKQLSSK